MPRGHTWALCWPVLQFLGGLVVTILLDIIHISIFYPRAGLLDVGRFGAGMAILSLLLKPFSCFMLYNMYLQRGGEAPFGSRGEHYSGEHAPSSPPLLCLPRGP